MGTSPTCCLWCWGPKKNYHLEIYSLSFKGSTVFLAFPHNSFGQSSGMKLLYLHARNALEYGRQRAHPNGQ